jgi:hypothetical protein
LVGFTQSGKIVLMQLDYEQRRINPVQTSSISLTSQVDGQFAWQGQGILAVSSGDRFLLVLAYDHENEILQEKSFLQIDYSAGGGLFVSDLIYLTHSKGVAGDNKVYVYELDLLSGILKFVTGQQISTPNIVFTNINLLNRTNILLSVYANSNDIYAQVYRAEDPQTQNFNITGHRQAKIRQIMVSKGCAVGCYPTEIQSHLVTLDSNFLILAGNTGKLFLISLSIGILFGKYIYIYL